MFEIGLMRRIGGPSSVLHSQVSVCFKARPTERINCGEKPRKSERFLCFEIQSIKKFKVVSKVMPAKCPLQSQWFHNLVLLLYCNIFSPLLQKRLSGAVEHQKISNSYRKESSSEHH